MPDPFDLTGRIALVTGASGGLGRHFAGLLARRGARVMLAARRRGALDAAVAEIEAGGGAAAAVSMDVTRAEDVVAAFDAAEARFGVVDLLVNNSGVAGTSRALEVDEGQWDRVLDTNLKGAFLAAREAASRMAAAGTGGAIVNVASILSFRVAGGVAPYAASKAGLVQLTRALALELARHRVRVNAIAPGYIETEMNRAFFASEPGEAMVRRIPQRRVGRPADLDGALLLLASDAGGYMTGTTVVVDGGHLVSSL